MADDISQMGAAKVVQTIFQGQVAISKKPVHEVERYFYTQVLTQEAARFIKVPRLLANPCPEEIIIEHLPRPVAMEEGKEADIMRSLVALHQSPLDLQQAELFSFCWNEADSQRAIARFPESQRAEIAQLLPAFHHLADYLFEPLEPVSGDTNIYNWGRRESGDPVLFDWERFGLASPAMDLAPLIPGLPTVALVEEYCRAYLQQRPSSPFSLKELSRQVLVACAWLVVEVVNILHDRGNDRAGEYMAWFQKHYPDWLMQARKSL